MQKVSFARHPAWFHLTLIWMEMGLNEISITLSLDDNTSLLDNRCGPLSLDFLSPLWEYSPQKFLVQLPNFQLSYGCIGSFVKYVYLL